jgi:hypothetical protein
MPVKFAAFYVQLDIRELRSPNPSSLDSLIWRGFGYRQPVSIE